jgi:hypothetical protein
MADLGMNIVTVIHQPRYSVFSLFHEVLLLGKAGRTVFQGPSFSALPYFISLGFELPPNENPADFFLDLVSGCVPCHANPDFKTEVSASVSPCHPVVRLLIVCGIVGGACVQFQISGLQHSSEMSCDFIMHSLPWVLLQQLA